MGHCYFNARMVSERLLKLNMTRKIALRSQGQFERLMSLKSVLRLYDLKEGFITT